MKLSTRLLLPLLVAVAVVMLAYALWVVRQREATLTQEVRTETQAYAFALGLAIEAAFRGPVLRDGQEIVDRLSRERAIYGVLVYDADGAPLLQSEPLTADAAAPTDVLEDVLRSGEPTEFERDIGDVHVYSVLRPARDPLGKVVGAYEVTQPLSRLQAEIARTRLRIVVTTLALLIVVTAIILLLVRRLVARPLANLVVGVRALAEGELGHRVGADPGAQELALLGEEFNRMGDRLQAAHGELVREAEERVMLERRLRESEKLAAVGNIAAGLAHEVGAPLHVIRGRAELLLRRTDASDAETRNLRIIVEQIERITGIVRNLLEFARRREPHPDTMDAGDVMRSVVEFLDPELERAGVHVEWRGPRSAWVRGDADLLHQVFMNLIVNAAQALEDRPDRTLTLTLHEPANGAVAIDVADNGPGVSPDVRASIFEPFVTTKASGEGTGLGLAIARSILEDHGGSITLLDDTQGATFRITLPASPAPEPAHA